MRDKLARIEEFCRQMVIALPSGALVNRLELPLVITNRPSADLRLRGKGSNVALYALEKERADDAAAAA